MISVEEIDQRQDRILAKSIGIMILTCTQIIRVLLNRVLRTKHTAMKMSAKRKVEMTLTLKTGQEMSPDDTLRVVLILLEVLSTCLRSDASKNGVKGKPNESEATDL
jgi:hypothetical protein